MLKCQTLMSHVLLQFTPQAGRDLTAARRLPIHTPQWSPTKQVYFCAVEIGEDRGQIPLSRSALNLFSWQKVEKCLENENQTVKYTNACK